MTAPATTVFWFGVRGTQTYRKIEAPSLARAIRAFRLGEAFPHTYSTQPIRTRVPGPNGYDIDVCLSSEPGAVIPVSTADWVTVAEIPPEGADDEFPLEMRSMITAAGAGLLPALGTTEPAAAATTALAAVTPETTGYSNLTRTEIQARHLEIARMQGALELQRRELVQQMEKLQGELRTRMEHVWLIELFLGSHEQVTILSQGQPAPANTPITVLQGVRCMDEEYVAAEWLRHPEKIGTFDCRDLGDFDAWIVRPENLDRVFPYQKGVVAFRVCRFDRDYGVDVKRDGIAGLMESIALNDANKMVYLLVRNGANLYRLWVDVKLWPRFFPTAEEMAPPEDNLRGRADADRRLGAIKQTIGGMMVLNGLLQRSDLFHPLPTDDVIDVFQPHHVAAWFQLIRDDEYAGLLGDGRDFEGLTWHTYEKWLRSKLQPGVRVLFVGRRSSNEKYAERTGIRKSHEWPRRDEVYTLEAEQAGWCRADFSIVYHPMVYSYTDGYEPRKRGIRFGVHEDEVLPIDFLSARVLAHLIEDRSQRRHTDMFRAAFGQYAVAREQALREKPFIDLVLAQAGVDPNNDVERARAGRLLRWWKLKVQEHRTLNEDEPKALRMILQAFQAGQDFDDDPERALLASTGGGA